MHKPLVFTVSLFKSKGLNPDDPLPRQTRPFGNDLHLRHPESLPPDASSDRPPTDRNLNRGNSPPARVHHSLSSRASPDDHPSALTSGR
jgi:hypothetical protein